MTQGAIENYALWLIALVELGFSPIFDKVGQSLFDTSLADCQPRW
jgi:hypothetical protein